MSETTFIGSQLAEKLGLNNRYFSNATRNSTLSNEFVISKFKNVTLVEVSQRIADLLETHTAVVVDGSEVSPFDVVVPITQKISVGFWK